MVKKKILYYVPIILLFGYLIFRLVDQSKIIYIFPLDHINDISSYMNMLHFFAKYGYHTHILDWYYPPGIITFDVYAPGWIFFAYPFFKIVGYVNITAFVTLIVMFLLGFIICYYFCRLNGFSKLKSIIFFFFFFVSPMAVGDYIRQMRLPQMLGWIFLLILILIVFYYRNRELDKRFLLVAPVFALLIVTHSAETILASLVILGLLVKRNLKDWIYIGLTSLLGIVLSLPWLYTFIVRSRELVVDDFIFSNWLFRFYGGFKWSNILGLIFCLVFLFLFFIYIFKDKKVKWNEFLFFFPVLLFTLLYLFRLIPYIPLFKHLYPDPVLQFLMFFVLFFYFSIKLSNKWLRIAWNISLVVIPLLFILISLWHTPFFVVPTMNESSVLEIFEFIDKPYITMGSFPPERLFTSAMVSYGSIYYNAISAGGWAWIMVNSEHLKKLDVLTDSFFNRNCDGFLKGLDKLDIDQVFSYGKDCDFLLECDFKFIVQRERACLYEKPIF